MNWELIIYLLLGWHIIGFISLVILAFNVDFIGKCPNCDFFMPTYIYKHCRVNYFGTLMMFLFLNILCPVCSFSFWFYKLCTVGRKELDYGA